MMNAYHEVRGNVIEMLHGEFPSLYWACGSCQALSAAIFSPDQTERVVSCGYCEEDNLVYR